MSIYTPYCYHLFHIPTQKHYYGVQWKKKCSPDNLWVTYFTSSKIVHSLIESYGKESFVVTIRKTFDSKEKALKWEEKFLTRVNASQKQKWLNQTNHAGSIRGGPLVGHIVTPSTRQKIGNAHRGKTISQTHRVKVADANKCRIVSKSTYKKISENSGRRGKGSWNKGIKA